MKHTVSRVDWRPSSPSVASPARSRPLPVSSDGLLMFQAAITQRLSSAVASAEQATNISLARLFEEFGRTALNDPKDILDADGNVLPLHEIRLE
jgi:hypothetical protein